MDVSSAVRGRPEEAPVPEVIHPKHLARHSMHASSVFSLRPVAAAAGIAILASCGGDNGTEPVEPERTVASVVVTPAAAQVQNGSSVQLTSRLMDQDGAVFNSLPAGVTVAWSSEDANIASVNDAGSVTGKNAGVVKITATAAGRSAQSTITVTEAPLTYSENAVAVGMRTLTYNDGKYYNAFRDNSTGDYDIYLRTSTDGVNWTAKIPVSRGAEGKHEMHPAVVAWGSGTDAQVAVAYEDRSGTYAQWMVAVSTDGGDSFQEPVAVSNHQDSKEARGAIAVGTDGVLYASWSRQYGSSRWDQTFFSRSVDGGSTWSEPTVAFHGDHYSFFNNIAAGDAGEVWIAIGDDQFYKQNIVVVRSSDGGETWSENQITSHGSMWQATTPNIVRAADGTIHVVWQEGPHAKGPYRMFHARSTTGGASWSTPVQVSDDVVVGVGSNIDYAQSPSLAIGDDGTLYTVWSDDRSGPAPQPANRNYDVYMATSSDNGETWSSDVRVNDKPEVFAQDWASVAVGSAGAVVVWRDARPVDFTQLYYRVFP